MFDDLYTRHAGRLEDFWNRQRSRPVFSTRIHIFGWPVDIESNRQSVLEAADLVEPQYSQAPVLDKKPFHIQVVEREDDSDPGPPPENLAPHIRYTGSGSWIHLDLDRWGQCFADLETGRAQLVLHSQLAGQTELIARSVLNTLLTNFISRRGYAMLHATGLVAGDTALMLMAPHNSGKSTTALRLAFSGALRLLSDSQVYVSRISQGVQLTGFPVGRGKLRQDMVPSFPWLKERLTPEQVRDETKFVLDLRRLNPEFVQDHHFIPKKVEWCLLSRSDAARTSLDPATTEAVWEAIMQNSIFYAEKQVWMETLRLVEPLVEMARCHHLVLGKDGSDVVDVVREGLFA